MTVEMAGEVFGSDHYRGTTIVGMARVCAVIGAVLSLLDHVPLYAGAEKASDSTLISFSNITADWTSRENNFRSVHMSWHVIRIADVSLNYQIEFPSPADRHAFPPSESVWLYGSQVCYVGRRWYAQLKDEFAGYDKENLFPKFVEAIRRDHGDLRSWDRPSSSFKFVWDNSSHRERLDASDACAPLGIVRNPSKSLSLSTDDEIPSSLMFWPILMAFRPEMALGVSQPDHGLLIETEPSMIGGCSCAVLTGELGAEKTVRLFVSLDQQCSVLRAIVSAGEHVRQQFDIEYAHDLNGNCFPRAWNILVFNPADEYPGQTEVFRSVRVEVDTHAFNGPVDTGLFHVEFPLGTLVNDRVSKKIYAVLNNGSSRPLNSRELRMLSGKAEPIFVDSQPLFLRRVCLAGGLMTATAAIVFLVRRRLRASLARSA